METLTPENLLVGSGALGMLVASMLALYRGILKPEFDANRQAHQTNAAMAEAFKAATESLHQTADKLVSALAQTQTHKPGT